MKKTIRLGLLTIALCFVQQSHAQFEPLTCEEKAALYLPYASSFMEFSPEIINQVLSEFTSCESSTNQDVNFILYFLRLLKAENNNDYDAYLQLNEMQFSRYGAAALALGMLYHTAGEGNFFLYNKHKNAKNLFNKMIRSNYKVDLAHYLIGYYEMKGLDTNPARQADYGKAKYRFETSNLPMAKHWLAVMHYFGLGVPKDEAKGIQMLRANDTFNSNTLADFLEAQNSDWLQISAEEHYAVTNFMYEYPLASPVEAEKLSQSFQGKLIEYEWEGTHVRRYIPFTLDINIDQSTTFNQSLTYTFTINGATITGTGTYGGHKITFDDNFIFTLNRLYKDHPEKETLTYKIKEIRFKERTYETEIYFPVEVLDVTLSDFDDEEFYELRMILHTDSIKTVVSSNESAIKDPSANTSDSLVLDKTFATIAPNPIGDAFTITYTLDRDAEVKVAIYDMFSTKKVEVPVHYCKANVQQQIDVNSASLSTGNYIVQMSINGTPYSKLVVKE